MKAKIFSKLKQFRPLFVALTLKAILLIVLLAVGGLALPQLHDLYLLRAGERSVYKITAVGRPNGGSGTGFLIKDQKSRRFMVTNYHVCAGLANENGDLAAVSDYKPNTTYKVSILKMSMTDDVCITTPTDSKETPLTLSNIWYSGQRVHLMGHPLGDIFRKSDGEIIGKRNIVVVQMLGFFPLPVLYEAIGITCFAKPGNSGSPVLNDLGNVVGILFAGDTRSEHMSFIIPSRRINALLDKIK